MQLTRPGSSLGSDMLPTWTSKAAAALSVLGSQTRTALRPFGSTRPLYSRSSSGDLIMSCCLTTTVDMILLDDENEFEKRIEGTRELIFGLTRAPIRDMTSKHLVIQFLTYSRIIIGQYNKKWLMTCGLWWKEMTDSVARLWSGSKVAQFRPKARFISFSFKRSECEI